MQQKKLKELKKLESEGAPLHARKCKKCIVRRTALT
jgi:hypothetical protein